MIIDERAFLSAKRAIYDGISHYPPVMRMMVDDDDRTWLRLASDEAATVTEWSVLDQAGEVVDRLCPPASLRLITAKARELWFVETDEFDMPYVVRYEDGGG